MAAPGTPIRFDDELLELLGSGVDVLVATRDADLSPECVMGMGLKVHPDRRHITVYVARVLVTPTLENLRANAEVAITMCRPIDHKTIQAKGRFVGVRDSGPEDRRVQEICRSAYAEHLAVFGVPRTFTRRMAWWPSVAIDVEVREIFTQTPGPDAGTRIAGAP